MNRLFVVDEIKILVIIWGKTSNQRDENESNMRYFFFPFGYQISKQNTLKRVHQMMK